jgi:quercetin dioxygenase-like cupin family protein
MKHLMNLHSADQSLSAKLLFKAEEGKLLSLHLAKDGLLDKHTTKTPALLLCVLGWAVYEDENGLRQELRPGEYVEIQPLVVHWVKGLETSELVLLK